MEQLNIYVENKVGTLSQLLTIISELDVNVRSVSTERANMSEVRLIVDDATKAKEALEKQDIQSHIIDIVVVEVENKPGELAAITKTIDDAGVNIEYMYGVDNSSGGKGLFAIITDQDAVKLREILSDYSTY